MEMDRRKCTGTVRTALSPNAGLKQGYTSIGEGMAFGQNSAKPERGIETADGSRWTWRFRPVRTALSPNAGLKHHLGPPIRETSTSQNSAKPERGIETLRIVPDDKGNFSRQNSAKPERGIETTIVCHAPAPHRCQNSAKPERGIETDDNTIQDIMDESSEQR